MGIFGPIDDNEAKVIIRKNISKIAERTLEAMPTVNASRGGGASDNSGEQLMWNMIKKAKTSIPDFIDKARLDLPKEYPYDDPSFFVACALFNRYVNAAKEDKKELSNGLKILHKNGLKSTIESFTKVYCDNIEQTQRVQKQFDSSKENAVKLLANNFAYFPELFPEEYEELLKKNNGFQRKRN